MITKLINNVHQLIFTGKYAEVALMSDLHWDNPHCDRKLLKKHLDYCLNNDIPVIVTGDFFCLMQGRGDNRRNKSDIRPEHNNAMYLDSIVETAVEWFKPYAKVLKLVTYGNHETGIIKYQETDILQRFVTLFNSITQSDLQIGGYGGWIIYVLNTHGTVNISFKHKYFHGSGGGGIVTRGAINLTRALEMYEGFDLFSMGHIHENMSRTDVRESLDTAGGNYRLLQKTIHHCITGTYKEEYGDGSKGWHVERGAPPKPLGGRLISFSVKDTGPQDSGRKMLKLIDSKMFPL
jgi:hypothetical protein